LNSKTKRKKLVKKKKKSVISFEKGIGETPIVDVSVSFFFRIILNSLVIKHPRESMRAKEGEEEEQQVQLWRQKKNGRTPKYPSETENHRRNI
jgi:hypothetical protein